MEKQLLEQKGLSSAEMQRHIRHYQDSSDELRRIMGNMQVEGSCTSICPYLTNKSVLCCVQIESYFILQSHGIAFS